MSTDNRANHRRKCKQLPDHDPGYPPKDYYERQAREAAERRRLAKSGESGDPS